METGRVAEVRKVYIGDQVDQDYAIGAVDLELYDVSDFMDGGGQCQINGVVYPYLDRDDDLGTITLSTPLSAAVVADTPVYTYPLGQELQCLVELPDQDEAIIARVNYNIQDKFVDGVRDELAQESVLVEMTDDGDWIIQELRALIPVIDGGYIDPATMPVTPPPPLTDGLPPTSSPNPTLIGGIGALFVRWTAITNHDPVTYEVHLSTTTGFTPGPTTLAAEVSGTSLSIRTMPDGSALTYWSDPPTNSVATVYYVRIVAKDADPGTAPPSTVEASGSMMQVNSPDVSAEYVYAGTMVADQVIGGTISSDVLVSAKLSTAATGQRVTIDSEGINLYAADNSALASLPTDPTTPVFVKGQAELDRTTINGNLSLRGVTNEVASGGSLTMAGKVNNPTTPPVAQVGWAAPVATWLNMNPDYVLSGMAWDSTRNVFWTTNWFVGTSLMAFDPTAAGGYPGLGGWSYNWGCPDRAGQHWYNASSVVYSGGAWYMIGTSIRDSDNLFTWEIRKYVLNGTSDGVVLSAWLSKGAKTNYSKRPVMWVDQTGTVGYAYYGSGASASKLRTSSINTTTLADVSNVAVLTTDNPTGAGVADLMYAQYGNGFDLSGANRLYVSHVPNTAAYGFSGGTLAREAGMDFPWANNGKMVGAFYGGPDTLFHSLDATGHHYTYAGSGNMWDAAQSSKWYAGYTLNDTNAAGTGVHTTGLSAKATWTMTKRAQVSLSSPVIQNASTDDPDSVQFYLGRGASPPVDAAMYVQATQPAVGVNTKLYTSVAFSGSGAPSNNFPAATPAKLIDSSGNVMADATGYGVWAPPGAVQMYAGGSAPSGWLLCDGSAVSRTIYAALFAVLGTTFGTGDGSTTFNLPDISRRFVWGATPGSGLPLNYHDGVTTPSQRTPNHNHSGDTTATGAGHTHTIDVNANSTSAGGSTQARVTAVGGQGGGVSGTGVTGSGGSSHTHGIPTGGLSGGTTSGDAFPNIALNFIIKS